MSDQHVMLVIYLLFSLMFFGTAWLRHTRYAVKIANWYHHFNSRHPILGTLLANRMPRPLESEIRRKNKSKFVTFLLVLMGCFFLWVSFGLL